MLPWQQVKDVSSTTGKYSLELKQNEQITIPLQDGAVAPSESHRSYDSRVKAGICFECCRKFEEFFFEDLAM
jgi:hypothetical protein